MANEGNLKLEKSTNLTMESVANFVEDKPWHSSITGSIVISRSEHFCVKRKSSVCVTFIDLQHQIAGTVSSTISDS